jgi:DNA-binding NarL/FixJ family response regulator
VLLDIQLPDIDGFEVARRLLEGDPALPIVLVSSRDRGDYGSLIDESGVRGFVSKEELSGASLVGLLE